MYDDVKHGAHYAKDVETRRGIAGATSGIEVEKDTAFSRAATLHNAVSELVARLEALADKLVGSFPEEVRNSASRPQPDGLLHTLADTNQTAYARVIDGFTAIERIKSALP